MGGEKREDGIRKYRTGVACKVYWSDGHNKFCENSTTASRDMCTHNAYNVIPTLVAH
jgi:hypothetical protein